MKRYTLELSHLIRSVQGCEHNDIQRLKISENDTAKWVTHKRVKSTPVKADGVSGKNFFWGGRSPASMTHTHGTEHTQPNKSPRTVSFGD